MKMPWSKLYDKTETRFVGTFNHFTKEIDKKFAECKEYCAGQIKTWKRSEQIKYNRVEQRLSILESIHTEEIESKHQEAIDKELLAAKDADSSL